MSETNIEEQAEEVFSSVKFRCDLIFCERLAIEKNDKSFTVPYDGQFEETTAFANLKNHLLAKGYSSVKHKVKRLYSRNVPKSQIHIKF